MDDLVKAPRKYDATARRAKAAARREAILGIAREHFLERGYAATSIPEIARDSGVSPESIYKAIGPKPALVRALWLRALEGRGESPAQQRSDAMSDSVRDGTAMIRGWSELITEVAPTVSPVVLLVREASAHDADMQRLLSEIEGERRKRMRHNAAKLAALGALRPGVGLETATDVMWTYTSPDLYDLLVVKSGWDLRRYAAFINDALLAALLGAA